ncbi:transcription termination factor NusB [Mycoplasmoides fastidiosum]|uniref:Transcription termination factor NusB n=1 Tax=Mycoplasmoides fastidiosum TaxID=92758 RepID=A0ABU0LYH7_9BACT|nr:DUF1948 domain-containing protein [Mycoplasmoides fastidiosum]MDQ0513740.1 transcription termination factor NusB [Mycoplasmoides fastidiosum]UUD37839.1 DUF1948 domain-containing protein [Mycoplasmoides fastidiosum]
MESNDKQNLPFWKRRVNIIQTIFADLSFAFPFHDYQSRIVDYDQWTKFEIAVFDYYLNNKLELMKISESFLSNKWTLQRLQKTTLAIILEAISEFHAMQTPKSVLIQQAVITAQKYSANQDYKLVNAILDNYFKSL